MLDTCILNTNKEEDGEGQIKSWDICTQDCKGIQIGLILHFKVLYKRKSTRKTQNPIFLKQLSPFCVNLVCSGLKEQIRLNLECIVPLSPAANSSNIFSIRPLTFSSMMSIFICFLNSIVNQL